MMRLAVTAISLVLLQASPTFAGGLTEQGRVKELPSVEVVRMTDGELYRNAGPSLSSSEIAAIQYHEPVPERPQPTTPVAIDQ